MQKGLYISMSQIIGQIDFNKYGENPKKTKVLTDVMVFSPMNQLQAYGQIFLRKNKIHTTDDPLQILGGQD